jgi:hypothetical protein
MDNPEELALPGKRYRGFCQKGDFVFRITATHLEQTQPITTYLPGPSPGIIYIVDVVLTLNNLPPVNLSGELRVFTGNILPFVLIVKRENNMEDYYYITGIPPAAPLPEGQLVAMTSAPAAGGLRKLRKYRKRLNRTTRKRKHNKK